MFTSRWNDRRTVGRIIFLIRIGKSAAADLNICRAVYKITSVVKF